MNFFVNTSKLKRHVKENFEFILVNIDPQRYNVERELNYIPIAEKNNVQITDLTIAPLETIVNKINIQHYITMMNHQNEQIPTSTTIPCLGCHRVYNSCPLGVPVKYIPNMVESQIKTDKGVISLISPASGPTPKKLVTKNDYFITDGMVCSFNCILTVIESNPHLYRDTTTLMYKMYKKIFGKFPTSPILRSPDFRLRSQYGGPLSDIEYEKCLQTVKFVDTSQLKMYVIGRLFEVYDEKNKSI